MISSLGKWRTMQVPMNFFSVRNMTSTEVSTALRPFYFSVHPDLFGQYPEHRIINENSLKQLSSYIESLQTNRIIPPCDLKFYVRRREQTNGTFQLVKILMKEKDIRKAVVKILKSCDLPTDYVDKLPKDTRENYVFNVSFKNMSKIDPIFDPYEMKQRVEEERESLTLETWLENNYMLAHKNSTLSKPIREDISRLKQILLDKWGILRVDWDCGWNETHFRGCLASFNALAEQHPGPMHILRGRVLVFAPFTGVSLDGHIMLYSGEVRHNWLDLIKNVKKYDEVLVRIPAFEKTVSQVLRNIKVVRRKFMPKVLAGEYERQLQQLTTALSDYQGKRGYPKHWPEFLEKFEIVVETEAGPLMVSPTGQFIVPSSCPGFLLVNFISENLNEAAKRMDIYRRNKYVERALRKSCTEDLQLESLHKDDSVTPDLMIKCCTNLLEHKRLLGNLKGLNLNITTYYAVVCDGVVCIPWNWEL